MNNTAKQNGESNKSIPKYKSLIGRPLLHGELDNMVQVYLRAASSRDATVNTNIAKATATALIQNYTDIVVNFDIHSSGWLKN